MIFVIVHTYPKCVKLSICMQILKWLFIWSVAFFVIYMIIIAKWSNSFSGDEAEPLKSYYYSVSRYELQKAVSIVLEHNKKIHHARTDSADHFNDGINFLTLKLRNSSSDKEYEYITAYKSRKYNGNDSSNSEISIPHASIGNKRDFHKDHKLRSELIERIEEELISKVDSILDGKRL